MDYAQARTRAERVLAAAEVPTPRVDAELLLAHVLDADRSAVAMGILLGRELDEPQAARLEELVARRATRIPLQHLTGTAHFRHLELRVGPGVFIPRPETETVVQVGLDFLATRHPAAQGEGLEGAQSQSLKLVDLCSGSGAIAAALATEVPGSQVWAVEISGAAIGYTRANCEPHGVHVVHADAGDLPAELGLEGRVDLVISNPPYIPPNAVPRDAEVREHDPQLALYGLGPDGLQVPRAVALQALRLLKPGGLFVMEHAEVQQDSAAALLREAGFTAVRGHLDLSGRPRATSGAAPQNPSDMKEWAP